MVDDLRELAARSSVPVIGAPLFIASGTDLVIAQCRAGILGAFPALNAREPETLDGWLTTIEQALAAARAEDPAAFLGPHGVNLIVHKSNDRLARDVETVIEHRVPVVITSVGPPADFIGRIHAYGGKVLHDVVNLRHARKALDAGVDGLVLVAAGAGGHAGTMSPFALMDEVRALWEGPVALAGAISNGRQVRAARVLGADFAYLGTRFIATPEASARPGHPETIVASTMADVTYTPHFSGIPGSYLTKSIVASGLDPADLLLPGQKRPEGGYKAGHKRPKAWSQVFSAGQGVGGIDAIEPVADVVERLREEYDAAGRPGPTS